MNEKPSEVCCQWSRRFQLISSDSKASLWGASFLSEQVPGAQNKRVKRLIPPVRFRGGQLEQPSCSPSCSCSWAGAVAGRALPLRPNSSGEEGVHGRPPSPQAAVEWGWNPMFTLSSGNYRKRSAHVCCIIVFAVVIGRARIGCRENVVLETLGEEKLQ